MADVKQLGLIDEALRESDARLRAAGPGAAVRELRVRLGMLSRVVRGWEIAPPAHDTQVAAMLECAVELRALVLRTCREPVPSAVARRTSRPPHARTTRPPQRADRLRTTRPAPPLRESGGPPSSGRG